MSGGPSIGSILSAKTCGGGIGACGGTQHDIGSAALPDEYRRWPQSVRPCQVLAFLVFKVMETSWQTMMGYQLALCTLYFVVLCSIDLSSRFALGARYLEGVVDMMSTGICTAGMRSGPSKSGSEITLTRGVVFTNVVINVGGGSDSLVILARPDFE